MVDVIKVEENSFKELREELKYYKNALWYVRSIKENDDGSAHAILVHR